MPYLLLICGSVGVDIEYIPPVGLFRYPLYVYIPLITAVF